MRLPGILRMAVTAFQAWQDDKVPPLGAALAYYTLFAMGPVLLVLVAVAGTVFGPVAARGELVGQIEQFVGPSGAHAVEGALSRSGWRQGGFTATAVGLLAIVLTASGAFLHLRNALNTIWRVPPRPRQKRGILGDLAAFALRRIRAFALVLPLSLVLIIALAASTALGALGGITSLHQLIFDLLNIAVSIGVLMLGFAVIYRFVPKARLPWSQVWTSAAITAALLFAGNQLLTAYLVRSATASLFGAAGSVVVFLIWVYYSAQIMLFGAEYSRVFFRAQGLRRAQGTREFGHPIHDHPVR